jgi:hypothetical protein
MSVARSLLIMVLTRSSTSFGIPSQVLSALGAFPLLHSLFFRKATVLPCGHTSWSTTLGRFPFDQITGWRDR